ncbi:hypothetical protein NQZ68_012911 [Dissostichus eleginoides]|nr:hypothetical protein NQZ68_012911 [Dissostichus eleginoides]
MCGGRFLEEEEEEEEKKKGEKGGKENDPEEEEECDLLLPVLGLDGTLLVARLLAPSAPPPIHHCFTSPPSPCRYR